jgi:hypothetical protein
LASGAHREGFPQAHLREGQRAATVLSGPSGPPLRLAKRSGRSRMGMTGLSRPARHRYRPRHRCGSSVIFRSPAKRQQPRRRSGWLGRPRACYATTRGRYHILLTRAPFHLHYVRVLELCGQRRARARSHAGAGGVTLAVLSLPRFSPGSSLASLRRLEHRARLFAVRQLVSRGIHRSTMSEVR